MRTQVKRIIKILMMVALIMCWAISLGYANSIKTSNKTVNFYFEDTKVTSTAIDDLKKANEGMAMVGWREDSLQTVVNADINRKADNVKILFIRGNASLLLKSSTLFEDDKDGCLIDEDTAYKLFGSLNAIGREIKYYDRTLIVRGIHNDTKSNVIMHVDDKTPLELKGLTIDATGMSRNQINEFKTSAGFKEMPIEGGIYYGLAKFISLLFPIIALILIFIKIIAGAIKVRQKPVFLGLYILIGILTMVIFFKVTKVSINIPLDMIPNKWSDFDFWGKLYKEYLDKFEYVLYMKKYGIDIYNLEHLFRAILYSILTIVLFVINLSIIKIKDLKQLIYVSGILVLSTFVIVLAVYSKYGFDINLTMVWYVYPLYLCGNYFLNEIKKYNVDMQVNIEEDNMVVIES